MVDPEIRLFGGVEVRRAGRLVPLAGRRVRTLIALLALDAGRTVSIDRLARGIWDDEPPERVRGSLQTYVSRLRSTLGDDVVTTEPTGYALRISRQRVDALRFRDGTAKARRCTTPEEERLCLDEALAAWEGEPFDEELSAWIDRFERPRLVEEYLQALERRLDLDLEGSEYAQCILRLGSLVEQHPLRETLWVRLLRALEGAGRAAEALERYETIRTLLATELGTDPGPDLQQLHYRLLSATESPKPAPARAGEIADGERSRTLPRQLPTVVQGFRGREAELETLTELATRDEDVRVVALHGTCGAGKTALATHWAQSAADNFPDGQFFVDLRGFGPGEPTPPGPALDLLLRDLGVPGSAIPEDLDGRSALLRSLLARRRCLILLDNARDAAQVRPLLPGGSNVVVVTSRSQLRSLAAREGARRIHLPEMSSAEATAMLRARLVGRVEDADAEDLTELAALCGHLPVALSIAAERAGRSIGTSLAGIAEDLGDEVSRLDQLATGDDELTDVRAVFGWTYRFLDADSARLFRLLALCPDRLVSASAAVALAGVERAEGLRILDRLADLHLLQAYPGEWFAIHDLVRAYARERVEQDPLSERVAATARLRAWRAKAHVEMAQQVHAHTRPSVKTDKNADLTAVVKEEGSGSALSQ